MVYSRSVITVILAAGAISSVLAVPVPAGSSATSPPGSVALRSSLAPTAAIARRGPTVEEQGHVAHEKRAEEGKESKEEEKEEEKEEKAAAEQKKKEEKAAAEQKKKEEKAAAEQREKEIEEQGSNSLEVLRGEHQLSDHLKTYEGPGPAATSSKLSERAAAPANGLRRREHKEHHSHYYDFSVLEEAIEGIDHAKERIRAAEDHLYHLLRMKDEGEFVSKHRLRKAKHRLEKAKHRLHVAEEHLQRVEDKFNKGEFDHEQHHAAPPVFENIVKHKEVGLEISIAPPPVSHRALYGDDLD
ncbi:hypothetical protein BDP27DRAFT_1429149 [Rhodocollybia butyracea]|uniref:Uncharacterized protein n=1 Tax=Rhodocollybia butyracea TaxID=206335 RepID=A0A9P5PAC3_9AGAR|nr:hypothetical protein BDP27DRAFT_1429149 [Rhodocollybia butyracea]